MEEVPCKDCITLAICKSIQETRNKSYYVHSKLLNKCSLIREFCYTDDYFETVRRYKIAKSFLQR